MHKRFTTSTSCFDYESKTREKNRKHHSSAKDYWGEVFGSSGCVLTRITEQMDIVRLNRGAERILNGMHGEGGATLETGKLFLLPFCRV